MSAIHTEDTSMTRTRTSTLPSIRLQRSVAALVAALAIAAAAPASHAGDAARAKSVSIHFDRATLADPAAARELYARIRTAARFACGDADLRDLNAMQEVNRCRADAVARAVETIGSATLGTLHRDSTGEDRVRVAYER
jgi:UrcA family protein